MGRQRLTHEEKYDREHEWEPYVTEDSAALGDCSYAGGCDRYPVLHIGLLSEDGEVLHLAACVEHQHMARTAATNRSKVTNAHRFQPRLCDSGAGWRYCATGGQP